jgi:hypothetical protein
MRGEVVGKVRSDFTLLDRCTHYRSNGQIGGGDYFFIVGIRLHGLSVTFTPSLQLFSFLALLFLLFLLLGFLRPFVLCFGLALVNLPIRNSFEVRRLIERLGVLDTEVFGLGLLL